MTDIVKKEPNDLSLPKLNQGKLKSTSSSFKQRLNSVKQQSEAVDAQTMPNRICLMLDCSRSMDNREPGGRRIDLLKDAVQNFVSRCSFHDTSVAIATFPGRTDKALPLTCSSAQIIGYAVGLEPTGNTPLHDCVTRCITDIAMTRGVIVSDGGATDWSDYVEEPAVDVHGEMHQTAQQLSKTVLQLYKDQGIPLDCVHISAGTDGEALLKRIAAETGGIFMKFSDVNAFSKAFGYLAPGQRFLLTSGTVTAAELGAKEIK